MNSTQSINDAFASMMDILNDPNNLNDDYDEDMKVATETIAKLELSEITARPIRETVEIEEFDSKYNVLNLEVRNAFKTESIYHSTYLFSQPINTTNTMEGFVSNVSFHEQDLILKVLPDENVVIYHCNYGRKQYEGYSEPVKVKKTNRGRKKKEKKRKDRKKQGTGEDFNSQLSFLIRDPKLLIAPGELVPSDTKIYKFKLFRTGQIQLPGVRRDEIDDVVKCTKLMVEIINEHLHPDEINPARISNIINVNPVMKNYRFIIKVPMEHIIDLAELLRILTEEQNVINDLTNITEDTDRPEHPSIFMLKYTDQDPKLSIKFDTPIYQNPDKKTRVNIFRRGKINILGAFDTTTTSNICEYIHWIFETYYDNLIVREGSSIKEIITVDNILISSEEANQTFKEMMEWVDIKYIPYISIEEANEAIDLAKKYYDDRVNEALEYVDSLANIIT